MKYQTRILKTPFAVSHDKKSTGRRTLRFNTNVESNSINKSERIDHTPPGKPSGLR